MTNEPTACPALTVEIDDDVIIANIDDGKANALSHALIDALHGVLDRAEAGDAGAEMRAVVIAGRPGCFSGGFELAVMRGGRDGVQRLATAGAELFMRLYGFKLPVIGACTGHSIAAGAIMLMALDTRIGAEGDFKVGMSEVAIGMSLPIFAASLAQDRLSPRFLTAATMQGEVFDPATAVNVGYLDRVVGPDQVVKEAVDVAHRLAKLSTGAHSATKQLIRGTTIEHVLKTLSTDMAALDGPAFK